MHGRPRKAPNPEEQEASSLKAAKLRDLQSQVLHFHHNKIYTKEAVEASAKLLESNPEHYTGWNYRKLAVQYLLDQQSETEGDSGSIKSILDEELRVVENALRTNYKSYGAWYHRKWVLSKGHTSAERELRLLGKFQKLDARNFHAWNYRRFITALTKVPDEEELQYTTDMICDNFSNYSAWHNRSVLLSKLLEKREKGYDDKDKVLREELEFVRNALFTDPDDQSGWFYHLWLLDQTIRQEPLLHSLDESRNARAGQSFTLRPPLSKQEHSQMSTPQRILWKEENFHAHATQSELLHSLTELKIVKERKDTSPKHSMETISNEIAYCRELLSLTNCKIGKLTLARLLMAQNTLISHGSPNEGMEVHYEEILALYRDLMKMDRPHYCYYEDECSSVLLKQVTSNIGSLSKYTYQYIESPPSTNSYLCVRLSGLSLSRIGSMECLFWVQMLDLSNNKLRSIEGLELLQQLSCLKLRNNKLCSFTALEPLRLLNSLEVLDISYNEIGAHSIDPRRYLCSSPLTHAAGSDSNFKEFPKIDVKMKDHWDAFYIFKDLNLVQLDIIGNAAVNDRLKAFIFKLMPTLRWLDGEECH